mmetsp:Transcript_12692/g.17067  ORF Transcript_12692/g.17067 Transcript_12692/m.17067 type:complete len:197 (+) Transcript_12692:36-626(+)
MAAKNRGIHEHADKLAKASTFSERMNAIGYNSQTWKCAEDEKYGREKLAAAHSRQGLARTKAMFADKEVDMEQEAAARDATMKRKQGVDSEVNGFLEEAQKAQSSQPEMKIAAKKLPAEAKQDTKPNKMPKLSVIVKRKAEVEGEPEAKVDAAATSSVSAGVPDVPVAAPPAAAAVASGGLGLGAYGSSSEDEEEE